MSAQVYDFLKHRLLRMEEKNKEGHRWWESLPGELGRDPNLQAALSVFPDARLVCVRDRAPSGDVA